MEYQEFVDQVMTVVKGELGFPEDQITFYPEGYTSDSLDMIRWIRDVNKSFSGEEANRLLEDYMVLSVKIGEGATANHRIAMKRLYKDAEKNGFDAAVERLRELKQKSDFPYDLEVLRSRMSGEYERIRDRLIIRPLNYNLHRRDLYEAVYERVSDFALVLYHLVGDDNGVLITSKIKQKDVEEWGMTDLKREIIKDALTNTARIFPACVFSNRTMKEEDLMKGEFTREEITMMQKIIVSTFHFNNGAVAIFYPGVRKKLLKIMGGKFLVVFMNVNDSMIFSPNDPMASVYLRSAQKSGKMGEMLSKKMLICDENGIHAGEQHLIY